MQIYNSLSGKKELFQPLKPGQVSLYVCGVTVYDYCHIGHARTYTTFDILLRYLRSLGYQVNYVRNITDVEDKIIKRAFENHETPDQLVARFTQIMHEEFDRLNLLHPNSEPKVTETLPEIIEMIQVLINKGYAYASENGDVYYEVSKFKSYGKLSKQNIEALHSGARVEINEVKKSPLDFVLWKAAKPGEPFWDSPWGGGRPGWHIECSAMSKKALGETFDIHGGGSDLRFPHHENEIAQSEAANGHPFARYWMHSGMVQVNNEKMSKSLNNFFVIKDVLEEYPAEAVRYFLMSGHYRSEINYSKDNLNSAKAGLTRLYRALEGAQFEAPAPDSGYETRFNAALADDLNTPEALAVLFDLAKEINKTQDPGLHALLKKLGAILGILQQDPTHFLQGNVSTVDEAKIEILIQSRKAARLARDFAESDRIRDALKALSIELEDQPDGTTDWRKI
ncbi:MAG: cysteine--tRNA ligase [Gammaproteobacteria bacterium]|nr:cysteine--tRNA ligase [Gammaproteobacteria bacterium]